MEQNNNPNFLAKNLNKYSQLGLWQHLSSEKTEEQRNQMRESWANIMDEKGIKKKII
jgi:hypothetical protein